MIQICQRFCSLRDFPPSPRVVVLAPPALVIVLHARGKRQRLKRVITRPGGEATAENNVPALCGTDLISAADEGIEHHPPRMRVVVFRCGNVSTGMRRRVLRLDRPEEAV